MTEAEKLEQAINDLVDVTVAHVMDNAITTFNKMEDKKLQKKIAEKIVNSTYFQCKGYIEQYFKNNQ